MNEKKLVFILDAHLPYVRDPDHPGMVEESWLFNELSFTYLPLLRSFTALETEGVPFYIAIAFSPELSEMLSDPLLQNRYMAHLDHSIDYAEYVIENNLLDEGRTSLLKVYLNVLKKNRRDFVDIYEKNILKKFDYFSERGYLEIMATSATACFFPLYSDIQEAVNAQIETGLMAHRAHFDSIPDGFWLPALGWFPGAEKNLKAYGFRYSIVENIALLFSDSPPSSGVFSPVCCENGFNLFPRDSFASAEFFKEGKGYSLNPVYLDVDNDIGFEMDVADLAPLFDAKMGRRITGFRYMARASRENGGEVLYDPAAAAAQIDKDASGFLDSCSDLLSKASGLLEGESVCRTCVFNASFFGHDWYEGVSWLEKVFRLAASRDDISFSTPSSFLKKKYENKTVKPETVNPVFSSWFETGYADELLNNSNDWIYQYIKKATERMVDLAERFPNDTGLKERVLNMAAKELLLTQSLEWPVLMNDPSTSEYARYRFEESIKAFTTVYESLGSNFVSTEWLTDMERKHRFLPFINYRVFSRRK